MARPVRTNEELQAASEHLRYELDSMMAHAELHARLWAELGGVSDQSNGFLESCLVHCRNVMFFLGWARGAKIPHDTDVILEDFGGLAPVRPPEVDADFKRNVDKRLGHLTYDRLGPQLRWSLVSIAAATRRALLVALAPIDRAKLAATWGDLLDAPLGPTILEGAAPDELGGLTGTDTMHVSIVVLPKVER